MRKFALVLSIAAVSSSALAVDLPAALRAALAADASMAAAVANRDAAQENIAIARARLLPQVTAQGTFQELDQSVDRSGTVQEFRGPSRNVQLQIRQGVYRPRDRAGLDIGKLQASQGEYKLSAAQSDLWYRTVFAWVDVLTAQALRDVYSATVQSVARTAEQERRRFEVGDGTRDSMAEAAAQLSLARAQVAEATLDLQSKVDAFNLLTRLDVSGFAGLRLPLATRLGPIPETEAQLLARILDTNPELAAARSNAQITERRIAQNSADHLPTLDVVGTRSSSSNDTINTVNARYNTSSLGVQLVVPIYSGGGVSAAERQATAGYVAAQAERDAMIQKIRTQFAIDWKSQTSQRERAQAAADLIVAAQEQRRAAELGVKAGLKTWADVGAAELLHARRQGDLVRYGESMVKLQARLLSLLPADDPAWERWTATVTAQARY